MTLDETEHQLVTARRSSDPEAIASAIINHADTLVKKGLLGEAKSLLDEALLIHREKGRSYDEARCAQFIATLCRLEGKLGEAATYATRAKELAGHGNPTIVSAETELGEIALATGDAQAAVAAFGNAITEGVSAGLLPAAQAVLRRKRAIALSNINEFFQAASELLMACEQLLSADNVSEAIQAKLEAATAFQLAGDNIAAKRTRDEAMRMAELTGDHKALAELNLLVAADAVEQRDLDAALAAAKVAREEALLAVAPMSYISAACAISELAEKKGDRLAAYEALVVGWATLGDLLGKELAKETFAPKLEALIGAWGEAQFRKIKAQYEAKRRAATSLSENKKSVAEKPF